MTATHFMEWCDTCRECRVFGTEAERDYWKHHHHDRDEETA